MDSKRRSRDFTPLAVRRSIGEVGDSASRWRRLRGLTQAQVAERAGVSLGVVRRLEAGEGGASLENVLRILRALGVARLVTDALDPFNSDIGRLRAEQELPERVRSKRLSADG
ncbi:MAG TPA: helix-turn-helix domain-containing protein [Solirubrobacteraceae bacterium]|jgi:transcriptional regulator with XRE-family HTH domain|nr:helix-turn-helix domain-containing protein [Solirubrobacteraceae bacterium]